MEQSFADWQGVVVAITLLVRVVVAVDALLAESIIVFARSAAMAMIISKTMSISAES